MKDLVKSIKKFCLESYDPDFNYEQEYWSWGNADDSFAYGEECGLNSAYADILDLIKKYEENNEEVI